MQKHANFHKDLVFYAYQEGQLKLKGNTHKAGPEIEKYLSVFRPELSKRDSLYFDLNRGYDWCCAYVYFLLQKIGYPLSLTPLQNSQEHLGAVRVWYKWALQENKFIDIHDDAKPGDLVIFNYLTAPTEHDHIGIVVGNFEKYLITSEGNVNNSSGIFKRPKDNKICGYISL